MARLFIPACLLVAIVGCRAFYPGPTSEPDLESPSRPALVEPVAYEATEQESPAKTVSRPSRPSEAEAAPAGPNRTEIEPIALALACLEKGDHVQAVTHLKKHVALHPDQVLFRAQLAELLAKTDHLADAQAEYERVIACTQEMSEKARERLVHYHTRLMEIGREREDGYTESLNRGIGLHLVACRLASKGETKDVERLQFKAVNALKEAQAHRPDDARPAWYLHRVWSQLDQPRPADKALRKAIDAAAFSSLTPSEAREISLAGRVGSIQK